MTLRGRMLHRLDTLGAKVERLNEAGDREGAHEALVAFRELSALLDRVDGLFEGLNLPEAK